MKKTKQNTELSRRLKRGLADARSKKGRFVDSNVVDDARLSTSMKEVDRRKKVKRKSIMKKMG